MEISDSFCFRLDNKSIKITNDALSYYNKNLQEYDKWRNNTEIPIFLDTNVLLDLYRISTKERNEFLKFLSQNKSRIFITNQVQEEYLKHRLQLIYDFKKTLENLSKNGEDVFQKFWSSIDCAFKSIDEYCKNKIIINDMPELAMSLKKILSNIIKFKIKEKEKEKCNASITSFLENLALNTRTLKKQANFELNDPVLENISQLTILSPLSDAEKEFIKSLYENLLKSYNKVKDNVQLKNHYVFPGCGDRKKLNDDKEPYGDLYIYHEILSYMKDEETDAIFLTNDITKSDWIKGDKKPFVHYITSTYSNTGKMMYIIPSFDFIPLSFEPLITNNIKEDDDIENIELLTQKECCEIFPPNISTPLLMDFNDKFNHSLLDITEEEFLKELTTSLNWSVTYGDGYVSEIYFIYSILGGKKYRYETSRKVLQKLIDDLKIISTEKTINGHTFKILKIKD